jgi:hypothetical protein
MPPPADLPPQDILRDHVPTWDDPVFPPGGEDPPDLLLGELMLMYFEWMGTTKVADAAAKGVYKILSVVMPSDANGGSWTTAQKMLKAIYENSVVAVDICPNDCIAYYNCKHPKMKHYQHAHRTWCPRCGADRKLTDKKGETRSAKQGYYLPCGNWFRDLFKINGMGPELSTGAAQSRPPGHVGKSRGWHKKVEHAYCIHITIQTKHILYKIYIYVYIL